MDTLKLKTKTIISILPVIPLSCVNITIYGFCHVSDERILLHNFLHDAFHVRLGKETNTSFYIKYLINTQILILSIRGCQLLSNYICDATHNMSYGLVLTYVNQVRKHLFLYLMIWVLPFTGGYITYYVVVALWCIHQIQKQSMENEFPLAATYFI